MGHSACKFMPDLYIAESYRPGTTFLPWSIFIRSKTASSGKKRHGCSRSLKLYQSKGRVRLPIGLPL